MDLVDTGTQIFWLVNLTRLKIQNVTISSLDARLAIAITANFKNNWTQEENEVEEIGGIARQYDQDFFKEMNSQTGVDLENIVYYKDEVHYFVMTAKKESLLLSGVLKEDIPDDDGPKGRGK